MTTSVMPQHAFRQHGRITAIADGALRLVKRASVPAALKNLAQIPFTVIGLGLVDAGVFTASVTAGLIVGGLLLIGLEFLIADEK